MSIASRIEDIEQHLTDDYSVLTLAGADLTNVDKNIVNLKPTWKERLLYFMNNGTDEVWNNWDKVTGEGTSITLDNTKEGKMKIVLKGNTYQNSTSGKNLFDDIYSDYTRPLDYLIHPITLEQGQAYTLKATLTGTKISGIVVGIVPTGEKYADFSTRMYIAINSGGNVEAKRTITIDETWTSPKLIVYCHPSSLQTTFENIFENYEIQLEKGSTATDYEKFTYGASPNPDYPQDIHVVSGDNSIEVGNNVFDISTITPNSFIDNNGNIYASSASNLSDYIEVKENNIILSYDYTSLVSTSTRAYCWFDSNKNFISGNLYYPTNKTNTFSVVSGAKYIRFTYDKNISNIKVSNKSASYPISLGDIQLLHIPNTNYYDKIDKSSGNNLFDKDNTVVGWLRNTGTINPEAGSHTSDYIEIKPNTNYIRTTSEGNCYYDENKTFISYYYGKNIATPSNAKYLRITVNDNYINNEMLNEGTTALEYEPYGTSWYVKKAIGKVVLDGSETWVLNESGTGYVRFTTTESDLISSFDNTKKYVMSDKFLSSTQIETVNVNADKNRVCVVSNNRLLFKTLDTSLSTVELWKTWLSTNNVEVRYVLATPTYTLIEDTTLINQLETIKKSYEGQTNISQTNNDLASILNATALEEMS